MDRQHENSAAGQKRPRAPGCPDPTVWYELAGGLITPAEVQWYMGHVSACTDCGVLLRQATSDLNDEATAAEAKQIAGLESAQPDWQHRLAQRIAGTIVVEPEPARWWSKWRTVPRLAMVTAGVLAVALVGYWVAFPQMQVQLAQKLMARAYTDQRTLAPRMAGARYAAFTAERGPKESLVDRPVALIIAEALIAGWEGSHSADANWLHAKARADLLDGKYDAAAGSLRRALQIAPKSPEILTDLATAYFQQGEYAAAYESLSQVLALRPNDPLALFNRALVSEHQFLYRQALDDWEHYLRVDPSSEWASEARQNVEAVRAKLRDHDRSHAAPRLSPTQLSESAGNPDRRSEVDQRIEEYLQDAVSSWLPEAYPEPAGNADPAARQALFFLADLTSQQHHDRWLSDLLSGSSAAGFPRAIAALARASQANNSGNYALSREQAGVADRLFQASGNRAGALRAQFERVFSEQFLRRSEECRREATAALTESERYSYPWLQIQLGLEKGVCSLILGNLGADQMAAGRALASAQQNGYGVLQRRALGFLADVKFDTGDPNGAWKLLSSGLARWWSGQFPAMRGYSLYVFLADHAEAVGRSNLQLALWSEALALADSDEDLSLGAEAHSAAARAAAAAGQSQVAEKYYARAAQLYALAPQSEAVRAQRLYDEIRGAQLESRQSHFDVGLAQLTRIQGEIRQPSDNYLALMFYSTLGQLQLRRQHEMEAEQALWPALALAEHSLASLGSEVDRTSWSQDAAPVYLALAEAQLAQGRSQEALEMYEWYLGASQRAGADLNLRHKPLTDLPLPSPSHLDARLPLLSRETVIAYALLPGGLAIWVSDDRGVTAQWTAKSTQDLQELASRFHDLTSDPKSELSAVRRDARGLYESLIAPVENRLAPGRTLIVEAEGPLARVPFEALLDSNDHYLVERWPIVHSLGQDSDARLRNVGSISADLPAVVVGSAASSPADGLVPLPDVAAEADTVASGFHSARVLKGGEATLDGVRNALPAAAVFHFAGHSLATREKTGLLLVSGEARTDVALVLDADTLRRLKLASMRLAVLSACSTASGSGGSGGFSSIMEALLRAGVPHVVASRWAVDSVEARAFAEDFYSNALSGQTVSDAIRLTSRKMLSNPRTAHPYYWSAFAAYGRP